ncbi:bifunctional homocysteine S-methyltransferase/methylenetetrahydrofolate reductase [Paenibacillus selenitireducens]|uniref:Bifunctional homocysteine S-methyltransferase/methylenetetrahydrofolate reductase n=1 Tax=Paenibacillus selenitireducens TaxID=1324314 RepID=A0A1T2XG24_9BACL|nr:bifunctional homocysteine S-methyltransferase/methylenetetrahydrofolate reductase [Paenibacillus selenitireducens]OPA78573.1 bifunctional homocysteine S-methyltransferase/methylenetetrahydrofolate reductase [Paenibacillus selenitireducens]
MQIDLRQALQQHILVGDGAMGTYLYNMGFPIGISYEELNLLHPDVIEDVHRQYVQAGAQLIETNTFSANADKLSKYGLEGKVEEINRAGVRIARQAAGDSAYVVGAVGPIRAGRRKNISVTFLQDCFEEQFKALLAEGVDGILLETFYEVEETQIALAKLRELSDVPVICQFAVEGGGRTMDGYSLQDAFKVIEAAGADVIGFNCHTGPKGIMHSVESIQGHHNLPLSVFPNAGIPDYVDGKYMYMTSPEYFGACAVEFANLGVRLIGGCCGTTPEHIHAMATALNGYVPNVNGGVSRDTTSVRVTEPSLLDNHVSAAFTRRDTQPSIVELAKQRHTVIVELDPPRDLDITKFMKGAAALKEAKVDALTLADNSLAVTRMSNMALGYKVKVETGLRPLTHIACRDRNLIGTQSHLMGFDALGMDHILAVTGDPARFGDLPGSSSVYDLTSFEIIRMIKQLNEGIAFSGKPLKQKANFIIGAAFNPNVKYLDKAVQRLEKKIEAGADYIMTQPVYDPLLIERIYESTKHLNIPIFIGIMPLASGRNAEYLHNEVPGIQLSDEVRKRMAGLEGEAGRIIGTEIARELLDAAMPRFNGIYFMTPFMFYEMSVNLAQYVWEKAAVSHSHL